MDVRLQPRFEGHRVDRAPAAAVGHTGGPGDPARLLRRDHVGDGGAVPIEIGDQRASRRLDRDDPAAARKRHPLDQAGVELAPGAEEELLLRELVLRIQHDHFRAWLVRLQVMGDQAGPVGRPDQLLDQFVDNLALDAEQVAAAGLVGGLRAPKVALLVAGRQ